MNSISGWFAIPLSLAVLGVVLIVMRCLKRKHVNVELKGLGIELRINTLERKGNEERDSNDDLGIETHDAHQDRTDHRPDTHHDSVWRDALLIW